MKVVNERIQFSWSVWINWISIFQLFSLILDKITWKLNVILFIFSSIILFYFHFHTITVWYVSVTWSERMLSGVEMQRRRCFWFIELSDYCWNVEMIVKYCLCWSDVRQHLSRHESHCQYCLHSVSYSYQCLYDWCRFPSSRGQFCSQMY